MLLKQSVEDGGLADLEVTTLDTSVVDTEDHVDVLHRLCSNIGELLDLGGGILDLYNTSQLKYDILIKITRTCSSLSLRLSCSTRLLTAFQPVNR